MISAYLLYCGGALSPDDAMEVFGQLRTRDGKGVTIPSQKRFVRYFAEVLKDRSLLVSQPVKLWSITLRFMDSIERIQSMTEAWRVYIFDRKENCEERIHKQKLNQLPLATSSGGYKELTIPCGCLELCGDIRVECRSTAYISSTSVFHFWFNTTFVSRPEIPGVELVAHGTSQRARFTVNKDDLDGAIRLGTIDASLMNQLQVQLEFDF
ncbi:hypothetical protein IWQ60_002341 [Tieghemiomyces parasiticus]|uniref:C2 tensin-type domain-containing protein n=1 Tax=Tieghemiomyces parasiticus TaxID=78921 RepID=A0A9W8DVT0_9FUNG|nr:hypothetical protein IWQ60_002341 [Tieghemiomyces parasiticus]